MNTLLDISVGLVSIVAAFCVGTHVGKKHIRGRLSNEWVLLLTIVVGLLAASIIITLLHVPAKYSLWVAVLIGSVGHSALE